MTKLIRWASRMAVLAALVHHSHPAQAQTACQPSIVSPFWQRLDTLCAQAAALQSADVGDAELEAARTAALGYCRAQGSAGQKSPPEFAALAGGKAKQPGSRIVTPRKVTYRTVRDLGLA